METNETTEPQAEDEGYKPLDWQREKQDWYLSGLVDLANTIGMSMSITLQVDGLTISGKLVGGKEYFEAIAKLFRAGGGDESAFESFAQDALKHAENFYGPGKPTPANWPSYIHLTNVAIYPGNGGPILFDAAWRGKLSSVSGFILGARQPAV